MNPANNASLLTPFAGLDDPRAERGKEHRLLDLVSIATCAVSCGAESWTDIEPSGQAKLAWFKTFLALPNGMPTHDTVVRLFARLEPEQRQHVSWITALSHLTQGEVIPIDGKTVRGSYERRSGKGAIHRVSAGASHNRLVLGQRKVAEKSNEITAMPQ